MAHFAQINDDGVVVQVIVVNNDVIMDKNGSESESVGVKFCTEHFGGSWVQTSYNGKMRKNYAGIGYSYDAELDAFIPPQPFKSWVLDKETCNWMAPVPKPDDNKNYFWDENNLSWVRIS